MGREIELKIPLTDSEYSHLKDVIFGKKTVKDLSFNRDVKYLYKKDEYFSRFETYQQRIQNNEPQCIRLRTEACLDEDGKILDSKVYFTIKRKRRENGIEVNREDETEVADAEVLRVFFESTGFIKWFSKEKRAYSVYITCEFLQNIPVHAELETVNEYKYLEIEITDEKADPDVIKEALEKTVKCLELNPQKKDPRSWISIINNEAI